MDKKGVELSLQTVIIAVLAILVLGVIIFLIFGGLGIWEKGKDCTSRGYACVSTTAGCEGGYIGPFECKDNSGGTLCCVK